MRAFLRLVLGFVLVFGALIVFSVFQRGVQSGTEKAVLKGLNVATGKGYHLPPPECRHVDAGAEFIECERAYFAAHPGPESDQYR